MGLVTEIHGNIRTFQEVVAGALTGKEGYEVEVTSAGKVQISTTGVGIGVFHKRLEGSTDEVSIRMYGETFKMRQNGAITPGTQVKRVDSDGRVQPIGASGRSLGVKIAPATNGAANDYVEVVNIIEDID